MERDGCFGDRRSYPARNRTWWILSTARREHVTESHRASRRASCRTIPGETARREYTDGASRRETHHGSSQGSTATSSAPLASLLKRPTPRATITVMCNPRRRCDVLRDPTQQQFHGGVPQQHRHPFHDTTLPGYPIDGRVGMRSREYPVHPTRRSTSNTVRCTSTSSSSNIDPRNPCTD